MAAARRKLSEQAAARRRVDVEAAVRVVDVEQPACDDRTRARGVVAPDATQPAVLQTIGVRARERGDEDEVAPDGGRREESARGIERLQLASRLASTERAQVEHPQHGVLAALQGEAAGEQRRRRGAEVDVAPLELPLRRRRVAREELARVR